MRSPDQPADRIELPGSYEVGATVPVEAVNEVLHGSGGRPAVARLIRAARQARSLSVAQCLHMLHIHLDEDFWTRVEDGSVPIVPDMTLAHMAWGVGIAPYQLHDIGRGDAADVLAQILAVQDNLPHLVSTRKDVFPDFVGDDFARWIWKADHLATAFQREGVIRAYQAGLTYRETLAAEETRTPLRLVSPPDEPTP